MEYVNPYYRDRLTLEDAAKPVALNKEYFCRFFKKNMDMSLINYVNEVRFSYVCEELADPDRSIMDLPEEHGFTNYKLSADCFMSAITVLQAPDGGSRRNGKAEAEADQPCRAVKNVPPQNKIQKRMDDEQRKQ